MSHWFNEKERRWLEMKEAEYRSSVRDRQFFNALIGRHPILYPALGLAITLLLPPPATRFGVNQNVATFIAVRACLGGAFIVFSTLLLLIGLVAWAWNQALLIFRQQ